MIKELVSKLKGKAADQQQGAFDVYRQLLLKGDLTQKEEQSLIDAMPILCRTVDDLEADRDLFSELSKTRGELASINADAIHTDLAEIVDALRDLEQWWPNERTRIDREYKEKSESLLGRKRGADLSIEEHRKAYNREMQLTKKIEETFGVDPE